MPSGMIQFRRQQSTPLDAWRKFMRRKRFQKGSLRKINGSWVARWRQDGQRKARMLGRVSSMTKTEAQTALAFAVAPLNNRRSTPSHERSFTGFVEEVYLPFYKRKWKRS